MKKKIFLTLSLALLLINCSETKQFVLNKENIILSAVKGEKSKIDTLIITNTKNNKIELSVKINGTNFHFFKLKPSFPLVINPKESLKIPIVFKPSRDFIGIVNAKLLFNSKEKTELSVNLNGLSTKGLEGKNEPSLSAILQALNYKTNIGWSSLANHIKPALQGEEIQQTLFIKANKGAVEIIPIARYSPKFELPFGYYKIKNNTPLLNEVGVLSDSKLYPEHQTVFPKISIGTNSFEPNALPFGIFTSSITHTAYSQDKWNKKFNKRKATHACRIYPLKNADYKIVPNQFLVCFEEAFNGDYQDYVFVLKNVAIFKPSKK